MERQILYKFVKLDLTQFATFDTDYINDDIPLELSSSFQFEYIFEDEVVCCTTTVEIRKGKCVVLKAELNSYFNIQSESVASMIEGDEIVLPTELMTQFASLGYGSMRGVIYAKTMGTPLERIILPPDDIQTIFTSSAIFRR